MKTGAVIVAAGIPESVDSLESEIKSHSFKMVSHIISNFQRANIFPIVVVTGYKAENLEKLISKLGVICVRNCFFNESEMFDSVKIGLAFIKDKCSRFFLTPIDIPDFTLMTIQRMMIIEAEIVKPIFNNQPGHPILISNNLIPAILDCKQTEGGLEEVVYQCTDQIKSMFVKGQKSQQKPLNEGCYQQNDINNLQMFRPVVDVSLMREGTVLDKNSALLLWMIDHMGTVKEASSKSGISYSKAWQMIAELEQNLDYSIIERHQGGESGGKSFLTEEGKKLLILYEELVEAIKDYTNSIFQSIF